MTLVLAGNGFLIGHYFKKQVEYQSWVAHTLQVVSRLDQIRNNVLDAETGQRGFLLTHDERFLEPYESGSREMIENAHALQTMVADNAVQLEGARLLTRLIEERGTHLTRVLREARASSLSRPETQVLLDRGAELMANVRSQISKMRNSESELLVQRSRELDERRGFFFILVAATTVLSIMAVLLAAHLVRKNQISLEERRLRSETESRIRDALTSIGQVMVEGQSLPDLAHKIQSFLAERLEILASKVFLKEGSKLKLISTFGAAVGSNGTERHANLLDQAANRNQVWRIGEVPDEYWKISSELGAARPRELIFMPLHFQQRSLGVIEMGAFRQISTTDAEILLRLTDLISSHINAAMSRDELQHLLEKTQQQAEELQAQQEELRTNNEELEQQARVLEGQQLALGVKNRELEETRRDLEHKAVDLQRSSQYKSDFLAKMSHELRTPLNGLLILSTLLMENKEQNLSEQQRQFAKSINSAGNDLLLLINDILDLSKIEARKLSVRLEDFSTGSLADSLASTFQPQAEAKKVGFLLKIDRATRTHVITTDRQRLEQILRNFLSNAIKFTDQGEVHLEFEDRGQSLQIRVTDTGIGIPANKLGLIFEAFEQADGTVSRRFGGTGLGLTISRELAQLLGGTIAVQSRENEGSTFTLNIPWKNQAGASTPNLRTDVPMPAPVVLDPDHSEQTRRLEREAESALADLPKEGRTLLVVEDDTSFAESIVNAAKGFGFNAVRTSDGEVALAILDRFIPDAILLDIKLPGISGLGVLEIIKRQAHLRHIPVHMISGLEYQHSALRLGALGYLAKPVTMEKIRSAMDRVRSLIENKLRRVLLIEDDPRQSEGIAQLVAGQDVEIHHVATGSEALRELEETAYDCVILDLSLPDINGLELLKQLNALEISLPPVVIYTAKDLSVEEEDQLRRYSESIIIKGARSPERLLDEVNLFLHRVESMLPEDKRQMLMQLRTQKDRFEGETVLLVDDDMRNLFALTSVLEGKNLNVLVAKDGAEALEKIESHSNIQMVFMDIMMPRMNGFEAMRAIRSHSDARVRQLPIVALTAKAMREDHERCIAEGANDYIPKPVDLNQLTTALKVWLAPKGIFA